MTSVAVLIVAGAFSPTARAASADEPSTPSAYDRAVLRDSPSAYWPLEQQGSIKDLTGHGHNGSFRGGVSSSAELPNGELATDFDGSGQYGQIPDADALSVPTTGKLTVEVWLRPDVLQFPQEEGSGYVHWMGKGDTGEQEYVARMYSKDNQEQRPNRISGYAFNPGGGLGAGSYFQGQIEAGDWIHHTMVINTVNTSSKFPAGYTKIYRDGQLSDRGSLADYGIDPRNGTAPFRIGTRDFASYFLGAIGKVAVYDKELSAERIAAHYAAM